MPRRSRISWKRRELADPPSIESSSDAANRRRSDRETPSPPKQRCTCSVSLRWKTERGTASPTQTGRTPTASGRGILRERREAGLDRVGQRLVLEVPGSRQGRCSARRSVTGGRRGCPAALAPARDARQPDERACRADARRRPPMRSGRGRGPAACPRTWRSPPARHRPRSRSRRVEGGWSSMSVMTSSAVSRCASRMRA